METLFITTIKGTDNLKSIVDALIKRSQYFAVEPLPDECYDVAVKRENKVLLLNLKQRTEK